MPETPHAQVPERLGALVPGSTGALILAAADDLRRTITILIDDATCPKDLEPALALTPAFRMLFRLTHDYVSEAQRAAWPDAHRASRLAQLLIGNTRP